MLKIFVTTRNGIEHEIEGQIGHSVMEAIREGGIYEIQALCGGSCSCATCQIYIDEEFLNLLTPMSDDENEILSSSIHYKSNSRLSCQVNLSENLVGLRIRVSPED